ncbi:hypothetical protein WA158_004361 [Blastocystis sp. Blastoise]
MMPKNRNAKRRVIRDSEVFESNPPPGISVILDENNIMKWKACIIGPDDTPFEGGTFFLDIEFTDDYPNTPPHIKFQSKMYHPNIYPDGKICLDILQNRWSPVYDTAAVLTSIQSLLNDPNPDSPANVTASEIYVNNKEEYVKHVKETVEQSWVFKEN